MSKLRKSGGFTLIELLVVIAIIGILSTIVLASLNTARSKGADAAIKADLAEVHNQTEMLYDTNSCYVPTGGTCSGITSAYTGLCSGAPANTVFGDPKVQSQISDAVSKSGQAGNSCSASISGTYWAVVVVLNTLGSGSLYQGWCVDSTGKSIYETFGGTPPTQGLLNSAISGSVCN